MGGARTATCDGCFSPRLARELTGKFSPGSQLLLFAFLRNVEFDVSAKPMAAWGNAVPQGIVGRGPGWHAP